MLKICRLIVLLFGALVPTLQTAVAQQPNEPRVNAAVVFDLERAQFEENGIHSFWIKGGAADASVNFWRGLGIAVNLTGIRASNIENGVSMNKIAFMAGPRYTFNNSVLKKHRSDIFVEWLVGGVHAFDSDFPAPGGTTPSANGYSMQAGGGIDIAIAKGFGLRPLEIDLVQTGLPNGIHNTEDDLRIAFGISYRH
jgi:hypothetical protein